MEFLFDKDALFDAYRFIKAKRGFNDDVRADLYDQIAAKMGSGRDLQQVIIDLANSANRFTPKSATAFVTRHWVNRMEGGTSFAQVVREHNLVPPEEILLISGGSASGKLPETLTAASTMLGTSQELKDAYSGALFMPALLVAGSITVSVIYGTTIIPDMIDGYDKSQFTGIGFALIQFSDFLLSPGGPIAAAALIGFVVWSKWSLNKTIGDGALRAFLEKYPPWNIYLELQSYSFLSTLAALLSVFDDQKALEHMQGDKKDGWQPTPYLLQRLEGAVGAFNSQGASNVADALDKAGYGFPSPIILSLLYEYASLPDFSKSLQEQAERLRKRMLRQAKIKSRKYNFYGLLIAGLFIGSLYAGFFDITDQLNALGKKNY